MDFNYKPGGDVLLRFMRDDSFIRGIMGPVGSGTSSACCAEIFRRAAQQDRGLDGRRKTRWGVIRNTNPMLKTTSIKTWLDWFPEHVFGKFNWTVPYTHNIKIGDIDCEVLFLALDRPDDVDKLLSLEFTGIWVNEARQIPKAVIDASSMRLGRFPSMKDGGPTWYGMIMDTNAPEEDHWWPIMAGMTPIPENIPHEEQLMLRKPPDWSFFQQPPGMLEIMDSTGKDIIGYKINPVAENVQNLTPSYYEKIVQGKTKSWIDVYILNRLGSIEEGRRVYPTYNDEVHVSTTPLEYIEGIPLFVGMDFGLTPAAVFGQRISSGRWVMLGELVTMDMGTQRFGELLRSELHKRFPGVGDIHFYGDPAGDQRAQTDERTPFRILKSLGINAMPTHTNDPVVRIESVESMLNRMVDGLPGLLLDPSCKTLRQGFRSGYHYRRLAVSGEARYEDRPSKNKFSHVHDALQYLALGGGEGKAVLGVSPLKASRVMKRDFSVWDMRGSKKSAGWANLRQGGL